MIRNLMPEVVIDKEWFCQYNHELKSIWNRVVYLNSSLLILKNIEDFPFYIFAGKVPLFWHFTKISLLERCVLSIWNIAIDQNKDGLTIQQLKNKIIQKYILREHSQELKKELRAGDYDTKLSRYSEKLDNIRHNFIAHYNLQEAWNRPTKRETDVADLREIDECTSIINGYFSTLSFGKEFSPFPLSYAPDATIGGKHVPIDVEILLDAYAKSSDILNMPEINPRAWPYTREQMDPKNLEIVNQYRVKFGLPAA